MCVWIQVSKPTTYVTGNARGANLCGISLLQVSSVKTTLTLLATPPANSATDLLPPLRNPPVLEATEDLTNLSYLNEPAGWSTLISLINLLKTNLNSRAVLHTILHRYSLRQIYTYSGIVLVAVNPFSSLSVYSPSIVQAYAGRRKGELEPHLFAIAEDAYRCMVGTPGEPGGNQTIIVSGERYVSYQFEGDI